MDHAAAMRKLPGEDAPRMGCAIRSWKKQGCDVLVYFDNDQRSVAPFDALRLRLYLQQLS
jgi:uncharacterized protein YecE (DUF72 family)